MTYTWSGKVLDVGSARPVTDRVLFHIHTTHSATGALLLPGHVSGTASQYTRATKNTLCTTVLGVNLKTTGFRVAKSSTDMPGWGKAGHMHLCQVARTVTLCDPLIPYGR